MNSRHLFAGLVSCLLSFSSLGYAELNIDADCTALVGILHIPAGEVSSFKSFCKRFEGNCYKLETAAADHCGMGGSYEAQGVILVQQTQTTVAGMGTTKSSADLAIVDFKKLELLRTDQRNFCSEAGAKCKKSEAAFPSQLLAQQPVLKCKMFTAESEKWSPVAKGAEDLCAAMFAEVDRIQRDSNLTQSQANNLQGISNATSGDGYAEDRPGKRDCGLLGCEQGADGLYRPKQLPASEASEGTDSVPPSSTDYRRAPTANYDIRIPTQDARACGIFGCEANDDGTFSPKYAPKN